MTSRPSLFSLQWLSELLGLTAAAISALGSLGRESPDGGAHRTEGQGCP